jgi:hypothetical protein
MSVVLKINLDAARFNPEGEFETPHDLAVSIGLTRGQKIASLDRWSQSVQQRLAATSEGMPPKGTTDHDTRLIQAIDAAHAELTRKPTLGTHAPWVDF